MNPLLETAKKKFTGDHFATEAAGAHIIDVQKGYAKCGLTLKPIHYNANGGVMGGVAFTLADFAFAVATNTDNVPTVSVTSTIAFLSAVKGKELIAETFCEKDGRRMCTYRITVVDELNTPVAVATITGMRMR